MDPSYARHIVDAWDIDLLMVILTIAFYLFAAVLVAWLDRV